MLGEHVDYWNSRAGLIVLTARLHGPAGGLLEHLHLDSPYTPQVVVDGRTDALGRIHAVERAIAEVARVPKTEVWLSQGGDDLRAHVDHLPVAAGGGADVLLADH